MRMILKPDVHLDDFNPQNVSRSDGLYWQIGIPQERQRRIFQPFMSFKAKKRQGIGLFLVKELLKLEQGDIKVESPLGQGSKFIVSLPKKPS